jgi:membrane-associated phospholipid phosphatase
MRMNSGQLARFLAMTTWVAWFAAGVGWAQRGTASERPASPIEWNSRREIFLLSGGLLANLGANEKLRNQTATDPRMENRNQLWAIDRWNAGTYNPIMARISDALVIPITGALPMVDLGLFWTGHSDLRPFWEDACILAQALAWSSTLGLWVRSAQWHPRPLVFADHAPESVRTAPEAGGSFYSGHTNSAFVGISVLATLLPARYPRIHPGWLWAGGGLAAASVGTLRMMAGKHYPTDVVVGACMGSLFGWGFATWHLKSKPTNPMAIHATSISVQPDWRGGAHLVATF